MFGDRRDVPNEIRKLNFNRTAIVKRYNIDIVRTRDLILHTYDIIAVLCTEWRIIYNALYLLQTVKLISIIK